MWTRKQYLAGEVSHHEYYSQFVTSGVLDAVRSIIKMSRIMKSTDPHMNDIPLYMWDDLHGIINTYCNVKLGQAQNGGCASLSDTVCIAKAAARMIKEGMTENV